MPWSININSGQLYNYNPDTQSFTPLHDEVIGDSAEPDELRIYSSMLSNNNKHLTITTVRQLSDSGTGKLTRSDDYTEIDSYDLITGKRAITKTHPSHGYYRHLESDYCMVWPRPSSK